MTPILVRPVREQLEHDRVIRLLQARWKRKYTVGINVGAEQSAPVPAGEHVLYPDLVLTPPGARKPEVIVEVETAESVNNLEAMAEWVRLGQLKAEFHLYVPAGAVNAARRLCDDHQVPVVEICTYHHIGDEIRFANAYKAPARPAKREAPAPAPAAPARTAATPRRASGAANGAHKGASRRIVVKAAAAKRTRPSAKKAVGKSTQSQKRK